jgi:hypothetical protein
MSSMYTSVLASGVLYSCGSRWGGMRGAGVASVDELWERRCSSRWGGCRGASLNVRFAMSTIVSVAAQKYGADSDQPIGSTSGMAIRGSSPGDFGSRQVRRNAWFLFNGIL